MRKLILIPICAIALMVPFAVLASSGEGGFNGVVHNIEHQYHVRATRIPLMGLVSLVARGASHGSVSGLHIAEFEDFSADVDGQDLNRMVEEKLGPEWERVIRETSRKGGDQTLIFMHPEGQRMGLFVVDLDGHEMDLVQVSVDPDHLNESIGKYEHHHDGDRDSDESN